MPPLTETEMRAAMLELLRRVVGPYVLEDVTGTDDKILFGEMLLTLAREVLPADSWRREQPLGPPLRR